MDRFETEEQQVEAIKQFWKENGTAIIVGAVLGLGGLWGWRYYSDKTIEDKELASVAYQSSVQAFVESEDTAAIETFLSEHSDTGYSQLASLLVAQQAVEKDDFDKAKTALQSVTSSKTELADIARIRLAKIHISLNENTQALNVLEQVEAVSFNDQVNELKGDALFAQGQYDEARSAYNLALVELPNDINIKMKLDNIAYAKSQAVSKDSDE
ncbi:YfgM family protein [Agaribacter flavus]|uniref:Ancillary SecYEG translocon subunit n=1 Tax=Agaribacter flavus TaxID=1902781 RepID=A0ABV7FPF4_9ALTE